MKKSLCTLLLGSLLLFASAAQASTYDLNQVHSALISEIEKLQVQTMPELSVEERMAKVERFVFDLKKLNDFGLGSPDLAGKAKSTEVVANLAKLKAYLQELETSYQKDVRPLLVQNIRQQQVDKGAKHNKGSLIALFFSTKNNHRTGKFMSGIWAYQESVSTSLFSSKQVDAGLVVNFPELTDEDWVKEAFRMEGELLALLRMHREYLDGAEYKKRDSDVIASDQKKVAIRSPLLKAKITLSQEYGMDMVEVEKSLQAFVYSSEVQPEEQKRMSMIQDFVKNLKQLDENNEGFEESLFKLVAYYQQNVKPVLVGNVRTGRADLASRNNAGEILSLFYKKKENHFTGKPVTGKLLYEVDNSSFFEEEQWVEVGFLAEHPELKESQTIKDALLMEAELKVLSMQHYQYLNDSGSIF